MPQTPKTEDFEVLLKGHVPAWRDPKHRPTKGPTRYVLGVISILIVVLAAIPHAGGYGEPLSMQVANGDKLTCTLFALMGLALTYTGSWLWRVERHFSSAFCYLLVLGLIGIAATNPMSDNHLSIFAFLLFLTLLWMWSLQAETSEPRLMACAIGGTLGTLFCFISLGIGERIFLLSTLASMNLLFYEFVLY
jgi:hypothetical protein